jgi:hypothetical protein
MSSYHGCVKYFYLLLSLLFIFTSCNIFESDEDKKKEDQPESEENYIELPATTKVLNSSSINSLISISDDGEILRFSPENLQQINEGDIILTGSIDQSPQGLLRKVVEIDSSEDEVILTTEQSTIENAFQNAHIMQSFNLKSDDIETTNLEKGVSLEKPTGGNKSKIDINLTNVEIVEGVTVSGSVGFDLDLDFTLDVDWFTLEKMSFIIITDYHADLNFSTSTDDEIDEKKRIGSIDFTPITITIGPVPVVFTIDLSLYVGMSGDVSIGIETGVNQEVNCTGGLEYEGDWHHVKDYTSDFDFSAPELSSGCHVKSTIGPELNIKLYGIVGPYAYLRGYIELDADEINQVPWWGLYGGFEGGFGVKVEVLGNTVAAYEPGPIINYRKPLSSGYGEENYNWEIQTIENTESGGRFSIAVDAYDYPHICYQSGSGEDKILRIAHFNGSIWEIESIDNLWDWGRIDGWPKLQIDKDNNPHVVYRSNSPYLLSDCSLKYSSCVNNIWLSDTLVTDGGVDNVLLFLDNNNIPHIFYNYYYNLVYVTKNGDDWIYEAVDDSIYAMLDTYWNGSISGYLDQNDNPHVFYVRVENTDVWKYAYKMNNTWNKENVPRDVAIPLVYNSSLCLDNYDNPYLAVYTAFEGFLYLLKRTAGNWHWETVDDNGGVGKYVDLAFDLNNTPIMACYDENINKLKCIRWLGEGWGIETVDQSSDDVGRCTAMVLDSKGYPHIAYYDYTNQIVKYAKWTGINL